MFIGAEDLDLPAIRKQSVMADSWDAALRLIDRYPWHRLYPLTVHPDFGELVWAALHDRLASDQGMFQGQPIEHWRELCGQSGAQ